MYTTSRRLRSMSFCRAASLPAAACARSCCSSAPDSGGGRMSLPPMYMTLDGKNAESSWAVSYTHLDVYKRQMEAISEKVMPRGVMPACSREVMTTPIVTGSTPQIHSKQPQEVIGSWNREYSVTSVSYTHLDVYKRQLL